WQRSQPSVHRKLIVGHSARRPGRRIELHAKTSNRIEDGGHPVHFFHARPSLAIAKQTVRLVVLNPCPVLKDLKGAAFFSRRERFASNHPIVETFIQGS